LGEFVETDTVLARWRANAAAAGIPLSEEDIDRIQARGFLERAIAVEEMLDRLTTGEVLPDYLQVLAASTGEEKNG
jgi:hypothetical protein